MPGKSRPESPNVWKTHRGNFPRLGKQPPRLIPRWETPSMPWTCRPHDGSTHGTLDAPPSKSLPPSAGAPRPAPMDRRMERRIPTSRASSPLFLPVLNRAYSLQLPERQLLSETVGFGIQGLSASNFSRNCPHSRLFCRHHVPDQRLKEVLLVPEFLQRHPLDLPI